MPSTTLKTKTPNTTRHQVGIDIHGLDIESAHRQEYASGKVPMMSRSAYIRYIIDQHITAVLASKQ